MKTHQYSACNMQVGIQRVDDIGPQFSQNGQNSHDRTIFLTCCKKEYLIETVNL